MGTYGISASEIADFLQDAEEDGKFEGDFTEEVMTEGVRLFCQRLRKRGDFIAKR